MQTDDQLARDLGEAFHAATADLTYSGRVRAPHRTATIAGPAALLGVAGIAGVAIAVGGATSPHHRAATTAVPPSSVAPTHNSTPASPVQHVKLVKKTFRLDGLTLTYRQAAGETPLYGRFVDAVPANATKIQTDGPAQDYVGTDSTTGDNAAYVQPASGQVLEITSPDVTRDELITALRTDTPAAIPVVNGTDN